MRKVIILAAAAAIMAAPVWAAGQASSAAGQAQADMQNPFPKYDGPPKDRKEAIQRQKARLAVLEKMSDQAWGEWQLAQQKRAEQWHIYQQMQRSKLLQQQSNQQQPRNISPAEQEKVRQDFLGGAGR